MHRNIWPVQLNPLALALAEAAGGACTLESLSIGRRSLLNGRRVVTLFRLPVNSVYAIHRNADQ